MSISRDCVFSTEVSMDVEPGTTTLIDTSRYENNGNMTDVTWTQLPSDLWVMNFNGSSSVVVVSNSLSLDITEDVTMFCWLSSQGSGQSTTPYVMHKAFGDGYEFYLEAANQLDVTLRVNGASGNSITKSTTNPIAQYEWHLVGIVYVSGTGGILYIDGLAIDTSDDKGDIDSNSHDLALGAWSASSNSYNGLMSHCHIFNYAWTAGAFLNFYEKTKHLFGVE